MLSLRIGIPELRELENSKVGTAERRNPSLIYIGSLDDCERRAGADESKTLFLGQDSPTRLTLLHWQTI